jgi:hypothetical protein
MLIVVQEIKPMMIQPVEPMMTWKAAEIQCGDIICFQKILSPSEYEFIALSLDQIGLC